MLSMATRCIRDRFTIVRQLGGGGMGVVYEAIDQSNGRHVALKTMRAQSGDALLRFKQEFRALQDIHHPNLITLGDLLEEAGQWWFSMELVRGVNFLAHVRPVLSREPQNSQIGFGETAPQPAAAPVEVKAEPTERSENKPDAAVHPRQFSADPPGAHPSFAETRLRAALQQLIDGLHALHVAHKVHRDIKPDNALVTEQGRVVILDFGLIGEAQQLESAVIGTIAYMAPEQAAGRPVGPAADWYSVGVLLYEALTGRLPFKGKALEILADKQSRVPPAPSRLVPQLPPDLDKLCMDLLRTEPSERPDFAEIRRRLTPAAPPQSEVEPSGGFFIGRHQEMETLSRTLTETRSGQARTVLLHGESGVGKSAAMRRFADQAAERTAGLIVLAGRCYEHESVPFKAIDGLIDQLARTLKRWPRATVEALLPRRAAVLLTAFPVLGLVPALAEIPAGPGTMAADPQEQRSRVFTALRELLGRMAERQPLLLLIDDLQWTDADSLALLAGVMSPPDEPSLLLICTLRTGTQVLRGTWVDPARPSSRVQHLHLQHLSKEEALHLAQQMAGSRGIPEAGRLQRLVEEAGGHPLFIQELVRHTISHQADESPRLDDALWARIGELPEAAQELLRLCAVMGSPLPTNIAVQASALAPDEVERSLARLRSAYLLRASLSGRDHDSSAPESQSVEPYHDRVRELVVERLSPERRRDFHQRLAEALTATLASDPEAIAYHFDGAGLPERAGPYALQAAEKLVQVLAFERAARFYGQALKWLKPEDARRREFLIKQAEALINAGHGYEAAERLIEAANGADAQQASALRRRAGEQFLFSGYYQQGITLTQRAFKDLGLHLFTSLWSLLVSLLFHQLWLALRGVGFRIRAAQDCSAKELGQIELLRSCARGMGSVHLLMGGEASTRWLLTALRVGEPSRVAVALASRAVSISIIGNEKNWLLGQRLMATADTLTLSLQDPLAHATLITQKGYIHHCAGNWRQAASFLTEAENLLLSRCVGITMELAILRSMNLSNSYYLGEVGSIEPRAQHYLQDADTRSDRFYGAFLASSILPIVHLIHDRAEDSWREATARIEKMKAPTFGHFHICLISWKANSFLYEGRADVAYKVRFQEMPSDAKSVFRYAQLFRIVDHDLCARCALACAQDASGSRSSLLRQARNHIRALERERLPWADALACNLDATVAHLQGNPDEAANGWGRSAQLFETADMKFHAAIARCRQGQVVGGAAGRALVTAAELFMRNEGIKNPARWIAMLAPAKLD